MSHNSSFATKSMRKKPLSMKKLYILAGKYLAKEYGKKIETKESLACKDSLVRYLDFVWKNRD